MSEPKLISPLLDNFAMGDPISDHNGVRSCPAMDQQTEDKYIVKIISVPASPAQLDALLLTGAYSDRSQALAYYKGVAQDIMNEIEALNKISTLDGFVGYSGSQLVEAEDENGYDVYLLSPYRKTLERHWSKNAPTHLEVLNLGLDLCSALSVCRRSGYLYVAIKPENIYLIEDKGFRIGDIGLIPLDGLKWASLPDRYRSAYMAPELNDPFEPINNTIDVYAVGLILYQAFNGGQLPEVNGDALPAPEFADYEMAEIILKACAAKPEDRFQDPVEMGQALVGYMQRNGAHDTPIVPAPVEICEPLPAEPAEPVEELAVTENPKITAEPIEAEQTLSDETLPSEETTETDYTQLSSEVLDMISQADELITHPAPEPAIAPEPIDVQLPDPETITEAAEAQAEIDAANEAAEEENEEVSSEGETSEAELQAAVAAEQQAAIDEADVQDEQDDEDFEDEDFVDYEQKPKHHWVRNSLLLLLAACIIAAGALFYKFIYQQHIDSLKLYGEDFSLTVHVNTKANEELLNVVCYDTYGNLLQSPVVDGQAYFEDLAPDCAYTIKVMISGFHSLTGQIASSYSTPQQTTISNFSAVTGAEDGSVILSFTVDGPDVDSWVIRRTAEGEEAVDTTITTHSCTMTGLTVGKEYSFELIAGEDRKTTGTTKLSHVASTVVMPQDAAIISAIDGKLTVAWKTPADTQISAWIVRCFNEKGYDKTLTLSETSAVFENIVANDPYTIEIVADGMSVGQKLYVPENAVTISDFAVTKTDSTSITLTWTNGNNTPAGGWILQYSIDGSATKEVKSSEANSVVLTPYIPDCVYSFTLLTADSADVIGGKLTYEAKKAGDFSGYTVKRSNMNFKMVRTPSVANWSKSNLASSDYTTTFKAIQKASFLVQINKTYSVSSNKIHVTYVIRDEAGKVVNFSTTESRWRDMWNKGYGEFDLPSLPTEAGYYTVTVYFNDAIAGQQKFRIKG